MRGVPLCLIVMLELRLVREQGFGKQSPEFVKIKVAEVYQETKRITTSTWFFYTVQVSCFYRAYLGYAI